MDINLSADLVVMNSTNSETGCEISLRRKVIVELLSNSFEYSAPLMDDEDNDAIDTLSTLRDIFNEVCPLGDAMIAARRNRWQNMNKIILNEFQSKWEDAIAYVKENEAGIYFSDLEWLEAMWLHVIGCPSIVRSTLELLSVIRIAFSKCKEYDAKEIIDKLKWEGFRPSFAQWICDRCSSENFEDDVLKVGTCMPWNSYLFSIENRVHYTHLHYDKNNSEFSSVDINPVVLRVAGEDKQRDTILPLLLEMLEESWTPVDFAKAAFEKLGSVINQYSYILGHCCSEQSVVSMSKTGMSPLATFQSEQSCGHGMYFFELNWDVFQLTFDELNKLALPDLPDADLDPRGLQFRAFIYALTRVFQSPDCDAMSPCVLVFLIPITADCLEPFDAVNNKLPMCNDPDPTSWACTCPPLFSYQNGLPIIDKTKPMTASAICNAISMVQEHEIEKKNAFALLGGIVDFRRIPRGLYTSIISDNGPKRFLQSLKSMDSWDTNQFTNWINLLKEPAGTFRRPKTICNHMGGFTHIKPDNCMRAGLEHWNLCPLDPIRETVFVQSSALVKLLESATTIHVAFFNPDNQWTQRLSEHCHLEDTLGKIFSEDLCRAAPVGSFDIRHRYWKNISCNC